MTRRYGSRMWKRHERKRASAEPLSEREYWRLVEERTRRYFNMSVSEFRVALHEGRLDQDLAASDIALLLGEGTR